MGMNTVKLTVRLPAGIHRRLKHRAQEENRSLNQVVVDAVDMLLQKKEPEYPQLSEYERTMQVLRDNDMLEPMGPEWDKYISGVPEMTIDEIHEALRGVPPLSEVVIAERGER
jgi:hypothetical protein